MTIVWLMTILMSYPLRQKTRKTRPVPNSGIRLFSQIRWIVLWTIRPHKNTNSVAGWAFWCCTFCSDIYHLLMSLANYGRACMLSSHDPSFISHNQAVWARAAGTDRVKSAVDVTSCTIHAQANYSYSFCWHYSSKYEYTIPSTIRHQSEYETNIWYIPIKINNDSFALFPGQEKCPFLISRLLWCSNVGDAI